MNQEKNRQSLLKHSKEDIINAMLECLPESDIFRVTSKLDRKRLDIAREAAEKAIDEETTALHDYLEWLNAAIKQYGDGKTMKLNAVPAEVLDYGIYLKRVHEEAVKKRMKAERQFDALVGVKT